MRTYPPPARRRPAQIWANQLIARFGTVEGLRIDSRRKTVEDSCLLEGEASPIAIKIESYIVETELDKKFVRATDFRRTRPWLQEFLTDFGHQ